MQFSVKGFLLFLVASLAGGFLGNLGTNFIGITSGTDLISMVLLTIVPVLIAYFLYENYLRKQA